MAIFKEDLAFVKEAASAFEKTPRWETYRNNDNTLIALRTGWDRDELIVFRLGEEVGEFVGMMEASPHLVVQERSDS